MTKTNKAPAFQFYPKDWIADENVELMTPAERGAYIHLMAKEWLHNGIPNDDKALAEMSGLGKDWFKDSGETIKKCFRKRGKRLIHPRLEKERKKQQEWREKCSLGGQHSAKSRKNKDKSGKGSSGLVEPPLEVKDNTTVYSLQSSSTFTTTVNTIQELWNSTFKDSKISVIRSMTQTRKDKIKTRLINYSLEDFKTAINLIKNSDFMMGNNNQNWSPDFDWIVKNDDNILKVLEGNYNNKGGQQSTDSGRPKCGHSKCTEGNKAINVQAGLCQVCRERE